MSIETARQSHLTLMVEDPDDKEMELIGVDELTIRRLRKSDPRERRERLDREIRELMKAPRGR